MTDKVKGKGPTDNGKRRDVYLRRIWPWQASSPATGGCGLEAVYLRLPLCVRRFPLHLALAVMLCMSAGQASAQLIIPWRDIVQALTSNTTPPAGSDKRGYVMVSDVNGRFRYYDLETYLEDSLAFTGGGIDSVWLVLGTGAPAT